MYSNTGSTFCTVCGAGTYQVSQGSPSCDVCAAGTFISDAGTDSSLHDSLDDCIVCGAGKVLVDAATTASLHDSESDCELCPENTFNADNGVSSTLHDELSDCTACPPGMPGSLDRKVCGVCIKGSGISTGVGASGGCEICKVRVVLRAENNNLGEANSSLFHIPRRATSVILRTRHLVSLAPQVPSSQMMGSLLLHTRSVRSAIQAHMPMHCQGHLTATFAQLENTNPPLPAPHALIATLANMEKQRV